MLSIDSRVCCTLRQNPAPGGPKQSTDESLEAHADEHYVQRAAAPIHIRHVRLISIAGHCGHENWHLIDLGNEDL